MLPSLKSGFSADILVAYVAIGLKHLRLMVLLVALSLQLGLAYYTFAKPVYHAKSVVRVERLDRPMDRNVGSEALFLDHTDRALLRQFTSDHLVERTAKRLGVNASRAGITANHLRKITAQYDPQGNIVVEIWPMSQEWAQDWTETMVDEYLRFRAEKRFENRELIIQSFSEELEQISAKIDKAFAQKFDFKEASEMDKLLIEFEQLREIPRDLLAVNRRLASMEQAREAMANAEPDPVTQLALLSIADERFSHRNLHLAIGQVLPETGNGVGNVPQVVLPSMVSPQMLPWQELEREQRRLHREIRQHESTYLHGHPKMVELRRQLDRVNQALELELEAVMERFQLEYVNLRERRTELEGRLAEVQEVTRRHQRHLHDLARFDAGEIAWTSIHDQMTKHISALDFWSDKERVQLQFMGHLQHRDFPVSPNRLKLVVMSLALGLGLAISVPFFLEFINSRVSDPQQLEDSLKLASLGLVPYIEGGPEGSARESEYQEHFRIIRTNLSLTPQNENGSQVMLISSSLPNEGKTTVSLQMARSLAQRGEKTLLLDADLHRGRLHRATGVSSRPGLRGVIEDGLSVNNACVAVEPNLDLLPCGGNTGKAAELIDSDRFGEMMAELRTKYQRIIIDSPPVLGLSEAAILQKHVDGVLLVVWSESTPMHAIRDAVRHLQANGANITGFVLNRVDFSSIYSQYRYYYYSPDYYSKYARPEQSTA